MPRRRSEKLGPKQIEILSFIKNEVERRGFPPSIREMCEAVNLKSTSTVHDHLERLERFGYIKRDKNNPRSILITDKAKAEDKKAPTSAWFNLPYVGKVTAGQPILAVENIEEYFPIPKELALSEDSFVLSVKGDSMIEAGIYDGDYVVVSPQNTADNGDIVLALIDDEATIKRYYKEKDHIRLQPENSTMEPIIVKDAKVQGRVVTLFRRLN